MATKKIQTVKGLRVEIFSRFLRKKYYSSLDGLDRRNERETQIAFPHWLWYNFSSTYQQIGIYINGREKAFMENAGAMGVALYGFIFITILAITFLIIAVVFLLKKKEKKYKIIGCICLILSIICFIPILFIVGYYLYIIISVRTL